MRLLKRVLKMLDDPNPLPPICAVFFLLLVMLATSTVLDHYRVSAQQKYQPTDLQYLRLQVAQRDNQLALLRWQHSVFNFQVEAEKVKTENGWPKTVQFNFDTLQFSEPPPAPKPEPAKEDKKP